MRRLFHHRARGRDRILDDGDGGHRSRFHRLTVHDGGVELVLSFMREDGAFAGVEERRVFEDTDRSFDRVDARAAFGQDGVTGAQRLFERLAILFLRLRRHRLTRDRPRAAVHHQHDLSLLAHHRRRQKEHENCECPFH